MLYPEERFATLATVSTYYPGYIPQMPVEPPSLLGRTFAFVQVIAALVLMAGVAVMLAGLIPAFLGAETFVVQSGSMEPAVHVGAVAVVRSTRLSELHPGDIVTFRTPTNPDTVVTHRLIAVEQDEGGATKLRTKGDANNSEDTTQVDPNAVLGKMQYSVPYAGYIVAFCQTTQGRLLLIGLPLVFLTLDFAWSQFRRKPAAAYGPAPMAQPSYSAAPAPPQSQPLYPSMQIPPVGHVHPGIVPVNVFAPASGQPGQIAQILLHGYQALQAGNARGAEEAADQVLALDSRNEDGWLLKIQTASDSDTQQALLRTALALNPGAGKLTAVMGVLRSRTPRGPRRPLPRGRLQSAASAEDERPPDDSR